MPLCSGTRLGSYEILSLIGSGGMGEVYRGRDPKLNRLIAIKVLPETTAADAERRARLEREAQSIAALSHPNIVTIYSVEDADGVLFLTMEYVEGNPLSDLIVKGGLPLPRILNLAIPLADAISAAHQKGIAHRDLKPANVMVTPHGRVKVLDFGLAKLIEAAPVEMGVTGLPTEALTGEGRIVGTVAYMSPEQAEGKPIDHRSDLFSLGVILYELATGERPFKGDTTISTITSILRDTPQPITELNHALPRDLAKIVRRCLVKDVEHRYQTAKDLRNELEELKHDLESGELVAPGAPRPTTLFAQDGANAPRGPRPESRMRHVGARKRRATPSVLHGGSGVTFDEPRLDGRLSSRKARRRQEVGQWKARGRDASERTERAAYLDVPPAEPAHIEPPEVTDSQEVPPENPGSSREPRFLRHRRPGDVSRELQAPQAPTFQPL